MQNKWPLFPGWYGAGIGLPSRDYETTASSVRDEFPIQNGRHPWKGVHWVLEDGWTFHEWSNWCPSTISNEIGSYCLSELDDQVVEYEVSRQISDTFVAAVHEVCLEQPSLLLHWVCPKEKGKFLLKLEWVRNCLIVRSRDSIRLRGILTIFCCVRNSIPMKVNCWAGFKSDILRVEMNPRLWTVCRQYIVWDISLLRIRSLMSQSFRYGKS